MRKSASTNFQERKAYEKRRGRVKKKKEERMPEKERIRLKRKEKKGKKNPVTEGPRI